MKFRFAIISFLLAAGVASAQNSNLNPTIQVTNEYEGRINEFDKGIRKVSVPDSLYKFNLDFDYSGFENPYMGNSEFNPFYTDLELAPEALKFNKFHLKAGAGYTLHPELDMLWIINPEDRFKASIYANGDMYGGQYQYFKGLDAGYNAGFNGRVDWDNLSLLTKVGYKGVSARSVLYSHNVDRSFNALSAKLLLNSHYDPEKSAWRYGAHFAYDMGADHVYGVGAQPAEQCIDLGGFADFTLRKMAFRLGADYNFASSFAPRDDFEYFRGYNLALRPSFLLNTDRLEMSVGFVMMIMGTTGRAVHDANIGFFPTLDLRWNAIPGYLDLFAKADMTGSMYTDMESALEYRFRLPSYGAAMYRKSVISAGLHGNIADKVHYGLSGFYNRHNSMPFFYFGPYGPGDESSDNPIEDLMIAYAPNLQSAGGEAEIRVDLEKFSFGGNFRYDYWFGPSAKEVKLPDMHAGIYLKYNLMDRLFANVAASYTSAYWTPYYQTKGFVDVSLGFEYQVSDMLGFFIDGHNLAWQQREFIPCYAQKGGYFTAGIILNL